MTKKLFCVSCGKHNYAEELLNVCPSCNEPGGVVEVKG